MLDSMKLRKRLPGNCSNIPRLQPIRPNPFRKSRFICGRTRRQSRPGKVSGRMFTSMEIRLCRMQNLRFLTRDRPSLSSRRSARSSAAEHPLLLAKDKGSPIYSHGNRSRFLRRKRRPREPLSASRLRLSKRRKSGSNIRLSPRQNRQPRHAPRAGVSSSGNRAARRQCGGQSCGDPRRRTIRWFMLAVRKLSFKAEPLGNPLALRFLTFLLPPRHPRAGEAPVPPALERSGLPSGRRKGLLPKGKRPSRRPGQESKTPVMR